MSIEFVTGSPQNSNMTSGRIDSDAKPEFAKAANKRKLTRTLTLKNITKIPICRKQIFND